MNNNSYFRSFIRNSEFRYILTVSLFIIALILFRVFLKFSFNLTIIWKLRITINFAPLIVYYVGKMFRPVSAFAIVSLGLLFGDGLYCLVYGCGGELPIYLAISLLSYGGMVILISLLRNKNIILAYLVGTIWFYVGFMLPSYIYYLVIYDAYGIMVFAGSLIITLLNAGFIPIAILLVYMTKRIWKIESFDETILAKNTSLA